MKELVQQFGLFEILAHICPGVIVVASSLVWRDAGFRPFAVMQTEDEIVRAIVFVVLAYTAGLITASLGNRIAADYYLLRGRRKLFRLADAGKGSSFRSRIQNVADAFITALGWFPEPLAGDPGFATAALEYNRRIDREIYENIALPGISTLSIPWDRFVLYRTIMANKATAKVHPVLDEAEVMHRRFLFSLGVALAFAFVTVECVFVAVVVLLRPGGASLTTVSLLMLMGLGAALASVGLRVSAGRWWELEEILTYTWSEISRRGKQT